MDIADYLSAEYLVVKHGNGGGVIISRTAIITLELLTLTLIGKYFLDPSDFTSPLCHSILTVAAELMPWMAAAFGAIYAALYTRFSSQWTYLASLYNQIKQAEFEYFSNKDRDPAALDRLAEWKAGYIEDAYVMHLAKKQSVNEIIGHWAKVQHVGFCLKSFSPNYDILKKLNISLEPSHRSFLPFP